VKVVKVADPEKELEDKRQKKQIKRILTQPNPKQRKPILAAHQVLQKEAKGQTG
jgi:hypothetical protein